MSEIRAYVLDSLAQREVAADFCMHAPEGAVVTFDDEKQTPQQQRKYHAMFRDISRSVQFMGSWISADDWKRLLIDAFVRVKREEALVENKPNPFPVRSRMVPSLDGQGVVYLGEQSSRFRKNLASEFIEYLYAWGTENGARWQETEDYRDEPTTADGSHRQTQERDTNSNS